MTENKILPDFETYIKQLESLIVAIKDELQALSYDEVFGKMAEYELQGFEIEYVEGGNGILVMTLTHKALFCALHGHEWELEALDPQRVDATCQRCEFSVQDIDKETYAWMQRNSVWSL